MINSLKPSDEQFLASVRRIGQRLDKAQREISTGLRVSVASDDPDQISTLLKSRSELARVEQADKNLSRIKTEVDAGEGVMSAAAKLMERAATLAAQGVSNTSSAETRGQLAGEVDAILRQVVSLSSTTVEERYIFSGTNDTVVPYTIDPAAPNAISAYGGSPTKRLALDTNNGTFEIGRTAEEIFDNPVTEKNVFASLRALRDGLQANDTGAIQEAFAQTKTAGLHINTVHAAYGTAQNRVASSIDAGKSAITRLKTQIAQIEDVDLTAAILDLNQATQDQQAAFQARAQLPRGSLFDYLG